MASQQSDESPIIGGHPKFQPQYMHPSQNDLFAQRSMPMPYPMQAANFPLLPGPFMQQSVGNSSNFTAASSMNMPMMMMPMHKGHGSETQDQQTSHSE